jgi:hypothetical protein
MHTSVTRRDGVTRQGYPVAGPQRQSDPSHGRVFGNGTPLAWLWSQEAPCRVDVTEPVTGPRYRLDEVNLEGEGSIGDCGPEGFGAGVFT